MLACNFSGYLVRQLQKRTKCDICRAALQAKNTEVPEAELVKLKSRRNLIHCNMKFFKMIDALETCFTKHATSVDVYSKTVDEMLDTYKFSFPCTQHADDILAYSIKYYVTMRMRQFTYQLNVNAEKKCLHTKKLAKFCKT